MADAMRVYFDGEKYAGLLLAAVAAGIIAAAIVMWRSGGGLRAFAATLIAIALAEVALGVGLYLRTGPQAARLTAQLATDPAAFKAGELPRMTRVQRTFVVIEYVEVALILAAAVTALAAKTRPGLSGFALGLLISASMLLAFDIFAERRGAQYLAALSADR